VDKYGKGIIRSFVGLPETVVDVVSPSFKLLNILHFLIYFPLITNFLKLKMLLADSCGHGGKFNDNSIRGS